MIDHDTNTVWTSTTDLWKIEEINLLSNAGIKQTLYWECESTFLSNSKKIHFVFNLFHVEFKLHMHDYKTTTSDQNRQLSTN